MELKVKREESISMSLQSTLENLILSVDKENFQELKINSHWRKKDEVGSVSGIYKEVHFHINLNKLVEIIDLQDESKMRLALLKYLTHTYDKEIALIAKIKQSKVDDIVRFKNPDISEEFLLKEFEKELIIQFLKYGLYMSVENQDCDYLDFFLYKVVGKIPKELYDKLISTSLSYSLLRNANCIDTDITLGLLSCHYEFNESFDENVERSLNRFRFFGLLNETELN